MNWYPLCNQILVSTGSRSSLILLSSCALNTLSRCVSAGYGCLSSCAPKALSCCLISYQSVWSNLMSKNLQVVLKRFCNGVKNGCSPWAKCQWYSSAAFIMCHLGFFLHCVQKIHRKQPNCAVLGLRGLFTPVILVELKLKRQKVWTKPGRCESTLSGSRHWCR